MMMTRIDMVKELSERLAGVTQEIYKQEEDKKAMSSGYTAAINHLKSTQKKVARMITEGQWTEEELVDVGVHQPPLDRMMVASGD